MNFLILLNCHPGPEVQSCQPGEGRHDAEDGLDCGLYGEAGAGGAQPEPAAGPAAAGVRDEEGAVAAAEGQG